MVRMKSKGFGVLRRPIHATVFLFATVVCLALAGSVAGGTAAASATKQNIPRQRDPNQTMAAAQAAIERRDYSAAISDLKPMAKQYPNVAAVWFNLAYAYTGMHQNDAALAAYAAAVKLDPKLFQARINMGILLLEMRRPAEALPQLEEAVALKPDDAQAHLYLGRAKTMLGDAGAEKELEHATRLDPRSSVAWLFLGQLAFRRKDYAGARDAFTKAYTLDSKLAEAKLGAALSLDKLGQDLAAAPLIEGYLATKPEDVQARFDLAGIEMRLGQNSEAVAALDAIQMQSPSFPGLNRALGDAYALLHNFPASEKYYRLAIQAAPASTGLHRALAETLMQEKNYPAAETEYRAALKLDSSDLGAASGLAESMYFQNHYPETISLLVRVVQTPSAPASDFYLLAASYDHLHDARPAIQAYQQFLSLSHGKYPDQEWQAQQRIKLLEHEISR